MKSLNFFMWILLVSGLIMGGCSKKKNEPATTTPSTMTQQGKLPPGHPSLGELKYEVPKGWISEQPASKMRRAQFRLPGVQGSKDAILGVFYFPGGGGSVEDNLNRWYGQFKQPDGSTTASHVQRQEKEVNGLKVTVVYVTGTYLQPQNPMMMSGPVEEKSGYAMLAAIVDTPQGPWFFKAVGPQKTIDHWRDSFTKFVDSFKFE